MTTETQGASPSTQIQPPNGAATAPATGTGTGVASPPIAPPVNGASRPAPRIAADTLPNESLAARLERNRKQTLRDAGIEDADLDAWKAKREAEHKELEELRAKNAEAERSRMSEHERLQADVKTANERAEKAEARASHLDELRVANERDKVISSIAVKYIDPDMFDYAKVDLARHIRTLDPRKVAAITDREIERFFQDLVKRKPRFAPTPAVDAAADKKQPTGTQPKNAQPARSSFARRPAGSPPQRQSPTPNAANLAAGTLPNGKVIKPGQPNSATKAEIDAWMRSQNRTPYG